MQIFFTALGYKEKDSTISLPLLSSECENSFISKNVNLSQYTNYAAFEHQLVEMDLEF
jgi:hypothetical protein